jgi:hypothetical protein
MPYLTPRQRRRLELLVAEVPLPSLWFESRTDAPFTACSHCGQPFTPAVDHLIEKMVVRGDVVYEFALCTTCTGGLQHQLSVDSRQTVRDWFDEHVPMGQRINALATREDRRPESWTERCLVTGLAAEDLDAYTLVGHARGGMLQLGALPYLISAHCLEDLQEQLSKETRESRDRFLERYLGLPPQWKDALAELAVLV